MSREVGVLVERMFTRKQGKDKSKIMTIQNTPTPTPTPTSNIMLLDAKTLDNTNALNACVKFSSEFRDRFTKR